MLRAIQILVVVSIVAVNQARALTVPEFGLGPVIGYDFGAKSVLVGARGRFPLGGSSRFNPEMVTGFGGDRNNTLLFSFESQYVFNRRGSVPFFLGGSFGYLVEPGDDHTISSLVAGVERPAWNNRALFLKIQWLMVIRGDDSFRVVSGMLFGM